MSKPNVWFVIPSKAPAAEAEACVHAWREQGYYVALARELEDGTIPGATFHQVVTRYQGWARSVNLLVAMVLAMDEGAEWIVTGGDDYWPDPNRKADEIAAECSEHFARLNQPGQTVDITGSGGGSDWQSQAQSFERCHTFGVMQPTGDRWGERPCRNATCHLAGYHVQSCMYGATIERVAGSPWMGREFCRRMYHGGGPMYNGYHHNFADEELQRVAQQLGVFWQRRDLLQEHRHVARTDPHWDRKAPQWRLDINHPEHSDWNRSKRLFAARAAAGFPGHEPLEL